MWSSSRDQTPSASPHEKRAELRPRRPGAAALLDEAVAAARDRISRTFAIGGFSGTWAATDMAVSVTRVDDRVAAAAALEEAVTGAVVADLVDPETAEVLGASWAELSGLRAIPAPGSLANLGALDHGAGWRRSEPPPSESTGS